VKVKIGQNVEGEFELSQNTVCACLLPKGCISRTDLGTKLEFSENTQRGRPIDKKVKFWSVAQKRLIPISGCKGYATGEDSIQTWTLP